VRVVVLVVGGWGVDVFWWGVFGFWLVFGGLVSLVVDCVSVGGLWVGVGFGGG